MYNVFNLSASKMCRITLTTPSNRRNDEKTRSGCNPIILRTKDIVKNYKYKQMSSFVSCHPYLIVKLKSRSRAGKSQVKVRKGLGRSELSQGQVFHFPPTITTTTTTQVWLEEVIFQKASLRDASQVEMLTQQSESGATAAAFRLPKQF